jgi:hypothetical protein
MSELLAFEAAVQRLSLLIGLTRETDVQAWALGWLERHDVTTDLVEVVTAPAMLSPLREALAPLAASAPPAAVSLVVLSLLAHDAQRHQRTVSDRLHMLRVLREAGGMPREVADTIKTREDWHMLAQAGLPAPEAVTHASLDTCLVALVASFSACTKLAPLPETPG